MKDRIDRFWTPICFTGIVAASIAQPWSQGLVLVVTAGVILGVASIIEPFRRTARET